LIEYLRSSIEILLSLCSIAPLEREGSTALQLLQSKKTTPSVQCNTSILNRNISDDDLYNYEGVGNDELDGVNEGILSNVEIPSAAATQVLLHHHHHQLETAKKVLVTQNKNTSGHQRTNRQLIQPDKSSSSQGVQSLLEKQRRANL